MKFFRGVSSLYKSDEFPWIIICFGIILRIVQYLYNPSLYIDEARDTVVGILGRSFTDLFGPPPVLWTPTPPLLFFVIEKFAVKFFGNSEYILRLFPLTAGIFSLFLFYLTAKRYIKPEAIPIALILFATMGPLIYFSSSARPYTVDIVFALLIYVVTIQVYSKKLNMQGIALFGVLGATSVWFSNPSLFILGGVATCLILFSFSKKEWKRASAFLAVSIFWLLSFVLCYVVYLKNIDENVFLLNSWKGEEAFMPLPPLSFYDIKWFITSFFGIFTEGAGFYLTGSIASFAFIIGCVSMYSKHREKFFILISPLFFAMLASGLYLYPLRQRTWLFLVPAFLLLIAEGTEYVKEQTVNKTPLIGIVLIGLLIFYPVFSAAAHLFKPVVKEEIKPVLNYIRHHWRDGDNIYLHYRAQPAFAYYKDKYGFSAEDYTVGIYAGEKDDLWAFSPDYLQVYTKDLDKLRGKKRVWILFSDTPQLNKGIDEEVFFIYYLNTIGKQIDSFKSVEASTYLYDLSKEASATVDSHKNSEVKKSLHWNF